MISKAKRAAQADEVLILDDEVEAEVMSETPEEAVESGGEAEFSAIDWSEAEAEAKPKGGGRAILAGFLVLISLAWLGYAAWSAGRELQGAALTSPDLAKWLAIATGPLALIGLVWLMFGKTWRRETDRFTASVAKMRAEAAALHDVLNALSSQIDHHHGALGVMAGDLMNLGDEASQRLGKVTIDLGESAENLRLQSEKVDASAATAKSDMAQMLSDLPTIEASLSKLAGDFERASEDALDKSAKYRTSIESLTEETRKADEIVHEAAQRLSSNLADIDKASSAAAERISSSADAHEKSVDALLERSADALEQIRGGIDQQSEAVTALLNQAKSGLAAAGQDSADALGAKLSDATRSLDSLSARIEQQGDASQRMVADLNQGLAALDAQFAGFAEAGDERAGRMSDVIGRLREQFRALGEDAGANDQAILAIAERTATLRGGVDELAQAISGELGSALTTAESGTARLADIHSHMRPEILAMRDAVVEATDKMDASEQSISRQQQAMSELSQQMVEMGRLSQESGPALIEALLQVREAANRAAENAKRAIGDIIPQSAGQLEAETRAALERAIANVVGDRLVEIDRMAAKAVESAQGASERLTAQMLSIGQSATALEEHLERQRQAALKDDSEQFARRVGMLMESLNSASIDVQKILSDEIDEKAWSKYLKGNRGVFTRRAVRLIDSGQARDIANHYGSDLEFHHSVNRYVHDFEAMLRRILAERDGGIIAASLMTSDMGKLYAALAPAVDKKG